jgi:hypothetical protein
MPRKTAAPPTPEPPPSRPVVSYPPSTWLARLKEELISAGIEHDRAGLIARRVLTALVPQAARLEAMDHRGEHFRIDD